jgi:hypothetical protein
VDELSSRTGGEGGGGRCKSCESYGRDFGFRRETAFHAAVSRRPPIPLDAMVPRTEGYAYDVGVWDLSLVQGPFSVAPCRTLSVTIRNFLIAVRRCALTRHPPTRGHKLKISLTPTDPFLFFYHWGAALAWRRCVRAARSSSSRAGACTCAEQVRFHRVSLPATWDTGREGARQG